MEKTTFHTHTEWSDGINSIVEMLKAAEEKEFVKIGISDHLVLHPHGKEINWAIDIEKIDDYIKEFYDAISCVNIHVELGFEVDFFPDNPRKEELKDLLSRLPYQYLIGSIHLVDDFPIDDSAENWKKLSQSEINDIYIRYWDYMDMLAQKFDVNIIGHIDLPKKFGFAPDLDLTEKIDTVLNNIAASGKKLEINTAGWDKPCKEQYPSCDIIKKCKKYGIPLIINDDAHCTGDLGRYYEKTTTLLAYTNGNCNT